MKNYKNINKIKGFTLVEIIITIALMGLVLIGVVSFLRVSGEINDNQTAEFYFQADMRDAMLQIEDKIKKAGAIFTVPPRLFDDEDNRDKEWSYIGVPKSGVNKDKICLITYDEKNKKWLETPFTEESDDVSYGMKIEKPEKSSESRILSKIVNYSIQGAPSKAGVIQTSLMRELSTSTEVLAAAFVGDKSNDDEEPSAIAFKKTSKQALARPTLNILVDASESMNYQMHDDSTGHPSRMELTKDTITNLLDALRTNSSGKITMNVSIIDYAQFADIMGKDKSTNGYNDLQDEMSKISTVVSELAANRYVEYFYAPSVTEMGAGHIYRLQRTGEANIADALRLAYNNILAKNPVSSTSSKSKGENNYIILFMDGPPTEAVYNNYHEKAIFSDYTAIKVSKGYSILNNSFIIKNNKSAAQNSAVEQISHFNDEFKSKEINVKYFIVAIGPPSSKLVQSATELKNEMNKFSLDNKTPDPTVDDVDSAYYYEAQNKIQLKKIIKQINEEIIKDYWQLNGPQEPEKP